MRGRYFWYGAHCEKKTFVKYCVKNVIRWQVFHSSIRAYYVFHIPGVFVWRNDDRFGSRESHADSRLCDLVRSAFEGKSLSLSESCLLNGEAWFRWDRPRNEPCLCSNETLACGLSIACVLILGVVLTGIFSATKVTKNNLPRFVHHQARLLKFNKRKLALFAVFSSGRINGLFMHSTGKSAIDFYLFYCNLYWYCY